MSHAPIYLDHAAATPLDEQVLAAMLPYFSEQFYNPSSPYLAAKQVRAALEDARARVAHWLGAKATEVIFTAGATESINLAISGVMRSFPPGRRVLFSAIEHDAVRAVAGLYDHAAIPVMKTGTVDLAWLEQLIDDQTVLISIGYANNELGTIQPLKEIGELVRRVRATRLAAGQELPLYLHADASQAAGYLDLHANTLGVDLMTLNGGKIYGPKQTGVLFAKSGIQLTPLIVGGGQERGLRSGTENVPGIIGFAAALDLVQQERKAAEQLQAKLRDHLQRTLQAAFPDMFVNGNLKKHLPNILHVSWPGLDGERLVMLLDEHGIQAATGSACAANKQTESYVLQAIGLSPAERQGSLRLSLGRTTTEHDIERAGTLIVKIVKSLLHPRMLD